METKTIYDHDSIKWWQCCLLEPKQNLPSPLYIVRREIRDQNLSGKHHMWEDPFPKGRHGKCRSSQNIFVNVEKALLFSLRVFTEKHITGNKCYDSFSVWLRKKLVTYLSRSWSIFPVSWAQESHHNPWNCSSQHQVTQVSMEPPDPLLLPLTPSSPCPGHSNQDPHFPAFSLVT